MFFIFYIYNNILVIFIYIFFINYIYVNKITFKDFIYIYIFFFYFFLFIIIIIKKGKKLSDSSEIDNCWVCSQT